MPKVSVCIPTYNYANYLPAAIESVLGQKFADFELIVQDDRSSDDTCEAVRKYLTDPRIRFDVNEKNLGLAGNWNLCLERAKGEYVKFVFADDLLMSEDALGEMVKVLDSDREISLVACSRSIMDERSRVLKIESSFNGDIVVEGKDVILKCLLERRNLMGEPTAVIFRKGQAGRGFDGRFEHLLDMEMWFHLLEQGKFAFLNRPLCAFRMHGAQKTNENVNKHVDIDDYYLLLQEYLEKPYVQYGRLVKAFLRLDTIYQFWKLHKKNLMKKQEASSRIRRYSSSFFVLYPFLRFTKPVMKLYFHFLKRRLHAA